MEGVTGRCGGGSGSGCDRWVWQAGVGVSVLQGEPSIIIFHSWGTSVANLAWELLFRNMAKIGIIPQF